MQVLKSSGLVLFSKGKLLWLLISFLCGSVACLRGSVSLPCRGGNFVTPTTWKSENIKKHCLARKFCWFCSQAWDRDIVEGGEWKMKCRVNAKEYVVKCRPKDRDTKQYKAFHIKLACLDSSDHYIVINNTLWSNRIHLAWINNKRGATKYPSTPHTNHHEPKSPKWVCLMVSKCNSFRVD